ncbi:class I SAM-dependent methyltransferase [Alkalilimnicola ehrlichii MLHE-1]|uniref:Methyltransferase type 11 n=1 Tax=Alkalilimnicola ehrlichii (strain ATCC BAA-1101 / DSM 17681 / MLHE-1) TaxID=187272 RepID=Q0A8T2_ALKEH|nr:class I SAM-dependent methyltransferase [Alkalilimnicola ehrlichii]ABI56755.1 Methyltransferase type 11 [Alkalilimnicola ehrlichii MLHE-1]
MWDERYRAEDYFYGTDPNDFLAAEASHIPPGGRVLCLAEGEGRNAVWLARQGYRVTAVDASREGVRKGERLAGQHGVSVVWVHADLADYSIEPGCWDGIVGIFAHLPPALRRQVHGAAAAGLRPGGVVIIEAYTPRQLDYGTGGPPDPAMLVNLATLRADFPGLRPVIARERERAVIEGRGHTGLAHVVQWVARR